MNSIKRIDYLDYTKGFAILLMLFNHTHTPEPISIWIFAFHMPIFFIVSGMLQYYRNGDCLSFNAYNHLVKKRIYQLGVPYFIWCLVLALFYTLLEVMSGREICIEERVFKIFTLQGLDSMWFLPCFFFAEIILCSTMLLNKRLGTTLRFTLFFLIILGVSLFSAKMPEIWYLRVLTKCLIGFSFTYIGFIVAKYNPIKKIPIWLAFALFFIFSFIAESNGHVGIGGLIIGNGVLFFVNAIILSVTIIKLFSESEKFTSKIWKQWSFWGKNTIVILCTNNLFLEIIRLIDFKLTNNFLLESGIGGNIICFLILLLMEFAIIFISQGRLRLLFGKGNPAFLNKI